MSIRAAQHTRTTTTTTKLSSMQRIVLNTLKHASMTDEVLVNALLNAGGCTVSDSYIRGTRNELVKMGLVRFTGRYGSTVFGCRSRIWSAVGKSKKKG